MFKKIAIATLVCVSFAGLMSACGTSETDYCTAYCACTGNAGGTDICSAQWR